MQCARASAMRLPRVANAGLQRAYTNVPLKSGLTANELMHMDEEFILPLYARVPIVFTEGQGSTLLSHDGEPYLDFMSGVAVNALGHGDPEWREAVKEQVDRLTHISNYYHCEWAAPLAERLVKSTDFASKVFFCNSGCEANEAALKFARKRAVVTSGAKLDTKAGVNTNEKTEIVAFEHSFHGRSMGALSTTHKLAYRLPFQPMIPGVKFVPYNDAKAAAAAITSKTAAVIVEPVQGEGGVTPATKEFLEAVRQSCDEHDATLIFDEVQIGLARSGRLWCHEHVGVMPDILTFAKPIAAGLPMGGVLMSSKVSDTIQKGDHGTTFGGSPLVTRVATMVFDRLSDGDCLREVQRKSEKISTELTRICEPHIKSGLVKQIRGLGLLQGLELSKPVAKLITHAREESHVLFINAGDNVLRLAPALTVSDEDIDVALEAIKKALAAY